jgi:hypothetical protein
MISIDDKALGVRLESAGLDQHLAEGIATAIAGDPKFAQLPPADSFGAICGRIVIRSDDIDLLGNVADAVETAASVGFFIGGATADAMLAAKVSLAVSMFKLARQVATNGAIVNKDELRTLLALRTRSSNIGATAEELAEALQEQPSSVEARLKHLSKYPVHGEIKAFVELLDERWHLRV